MLQGVFTIRFVPSHSIGRLQGPEKLRWSLGRGKERWTVILVLKVQRWGSVKKEDEGTREYKATQKLALIAITERKTKIKKEREEAPIY